MIENPILKWYDVNQRHLPWRALPGKIPNPYHVLLSEVMLQQTTVITVKDYFNRFIDRWPTLADLAKAPLEDVYHAWQGLGYYSRAKNLLKCAQEIQDYFDGCIPSTEEKLLTLSGVGPYTAAAIAAIAFDQPTVPVDGNIIRVFSRLYALMIPLPALKMEVFNLVKNHVPSQRPGDFAQSLMDLGATVCKPKNPHCSLCPVRSFCQAYQRGLSLSTTFRPDDLPFREPKKVKPKKHGVIFWYESPDNQVWIRKRPPTGLLANLMEIPGTSWEESIFDLDDILKEAPFSQTSWELLESSVQHTFTHFHLTLRVLKGKGNHKAGDFTCYPSEFGKYAFPTLMKKVIKVVLSSDIL